MASMPTMTGLAARVELAPEPTPSLWEEVRPVRGKYSEVPWRACRGAA